MRLSLLAYALLGLLEQQPGSGYDLRKIFVQTPMWSYSDSPGAIYPALARLEKSGWIRGRVEVSAGLRRRKVFRLTSAGTVELKKWLRKPVSREEVIRGVQELMLRFAFTERVLGSAAAMQFLKRLEKELRSYVPTLREFLDTQEVAMTMSGRLALESGIRGYESQLGWTTYAIAMYAERNKGGTSS
jgi:DNA-binding PadR family transcriptional regulator